MIIGGQILDERGIALPGVNIYYYQINSVPGVIGANLVKKGVTTDLNGNWQLDVADKTMLNISFMGYKTIEVCSCEVPTVIKMQVDTSQLNNVDVYGKAKTAGMGLAGKLLLGGLFLGLIAKAIPSIMADNKGNKKGLNGFKKVSL